MCILLSCLSLGESRDFNTRSLSLLFLCWQMFQNWWTSVSLCTVPGISTEARNLWIPLPTSQIIAAYFLCQISLELLLSLLNQYLGLNLMPECRKWHFWASRFQNFLGEHALTPSLRERAFWSLKCYSHPLYRICYLLQNLLKPLQCANYTLSFTCNWVIFLIILFLAKMQR